MFSSIVSSLKVHHVLLHWNNKTLLAFPPSLHALLSLKKKSCLCKNSLSIAIKLGSIWMVMFITIFSKQSDFTVMEKKKSMCKCILIKVILLLCNPDSGLANNLPFLKAAKGCLYFSHFPCSGVLTI